MFAHDRPLSHPFLTLDLGLTYGSLRNRGLRAAQQTCWPGAQESKFLSALEKMENSEKSKLDLPSTGRRAQPRHTLDHCRTHFDPGSGFGVRFTQKSRISGGAADVLAGGSGKQTPVSRSARAVLLAMATAGYTLIRLAPVEAQGGTMIPVGPNPASTQSSVPALHGLKAFNGRIYMGYGNWNRHPAVALTSYDSASHAFVVEHDAGTDSLAVFRELGGRLFAPHVDPLHYEDFRDFSFLDPSLPGNGWRDGTPLGFLHIFDMAEANGDLFFCGSKGNFEGTGSGAALGMSRDNGLNWSVVRVGSVSRYYWCFAHGGRVHTQDGYYENDTFVTNSLFGSYSTLYKPTYLGTGTNALSYTVALSSRAPAMESTSTAELMRFDGTTLGSILSGVIDFTVRGKAVYCVRPDQIVLCPDATVPAPSFVPLPVEGVPSGRTCLEVLHDRVYVGDTSGTLWAANLDGSSLLLPDAGISNAVPDSFGRALATDGRRIAVGAPNATSDHVPLSGQVLVYELVDGNARLTAELVPPTPDFSGWYGKDVALSDDLIAVVEAGYDTTDQERASSARVHLFQEDATHVWHPRDILSVPHAHSAAFAAPFLFVGTANPAANQTAGRPGVNVYLLSRDATGVVSVGAQTQLMPVSADWGYKPAVHLAVGDDLLVAGFAGDVCRNGGNGMVSVFQRSETGLAYGEHPVQELTTGGPDHFGYAVAFDGHWLAVGAPRDDSAAMQAGAVFLYERTSFSGEPFVLRQVLSSPAHQAEANFGSALALRDGSLLIGAPGLHIAGQPRKGGIYVFDNQAGSWEFRDTVPPPSASVAEYGFELAVGGGVFAGGSRFALSVTSLTERVALWSGAFFVDATRPDDSGSGKSWATAKRTIQAAVDIAGSSDTVAVRDGIYGPVVTTNTVRIRSVNGAESTVIDGGGFGRCAALGTPGDYEGATLIGFTLRRGLADHGGGSYGGALINCILTENRASVSGGGSFGGALFNCILAGNSASARGGGACQGTLSNCTVADNVAPRGAGSYGDTVNNSIVWGNRTASGMPANYSGSTFHYSCSLPRPPGTNNISFDPNFVDAAGNDYRLAPDSRCVDAGNSACSTDAVTTDVFGRPRIHNGIVDMGACENEDVAACLYVDATRPDDSGDGMSWETAKKTIQAAVSAAPDGGIILVADGTYAPITTDNKHVTLRGVHGAAATVIDGGGAGRCATLGSNGGDTNSVLIGFTLRNGFEQGGGGARCGTLRNCLLTGNAADGRFSQGGASYDSVLENCTLAGNTATEGGGAYGGTLHNCIVWGNGDLPGETNNCFGSTLEYCCTHPLPPDGTGNIQTDPRFVDPIGGDFRLQPDSPCIDAGHGVPPPADRDIDGVPRPLDGNSDGVAEVDMGCHEFASPTADTDGDGASDAHEVEADTSPLDVGDRLRIDILRHHPYVLSFWSSSRRRYSLEGRSNLVTGAWNTIPGQTSMPGTDGVSTLQDERTEREQFYRLRVERR